METDFGTQTAERLADTLWDLWKLWHHRSHARSAHASVTAEQYWILRQLNHDGASTVSGLAKTRGVSTAAMTMATRKMEAVGWVNRTRLAENQRVVMLSLTESGQRLARDIRRLRMEVLREMVADLQPVEQDQLLSLLTRMTRLSFEDGE